jgi:hypothetical protein
VGDMGEDGKRELKQRPMGFSRGSAGFVRIDQRTGPGVEGRAFAVCVCLVVALVSIQSSRSVSESSTFASCLWVTTFQCVDMTVTC